MFRKRQDDELWKLQQELLAAEDEEYEEEDPDFEEPEYDEDDFDEGDIEDCFESDYEEEYGQELFYRNHANDYGGAVRNYANRYGRGSQKRFEDDERFEEEDFADGDVLYRKDYRKPCSLCSFEGTHSQD